MLLHCTKDSVYFTVFCWESVFFTDFCAVDGPFCRFSVLAFEMLSTLRGIPFVPTHSKNNPCPEKAQIVDPGKVFSPPLNNVKRWKFGN